MIDALAALTRRPVTWGSTMTLGWRAILVILGVFGVALWATLRAAELQVDSGYAYAIAGMVSTVVMAIAGAGAATARAHASQYQGGTSPTAAAARLAQATTVQPVTNPSAAGRDVFPEELGDR